MRIEQLEYLIAVAQYKSLTEAGEKLHISQQALSTLIRKMEEEIGVPLLIRTHRGSQLTEEGKLLACGANKILEEYRQLILNIKGQTNIPKGNIKIGVSFGLMEAFFSNLFAQLCKENSAINISAEEMTPTKILTMLPENKIDLAIVSYTDYEQPLWLNNDKFIFTPLLTSRLYIRTSLRSPLAQYDSISLETVFKEKILIYQPKTWEQDGNPLCKMIEHFCPECQLCFESNYQVHYQKLLQGLGISFTIQDNRSIKPEQAGLKLIPLKETIENTSGILVVKDNVNPSLRYIIDHLRIICANQTLE